MNYENRPGGGTGNGSGEVRPFVPRKKIDPEQVNQAVKSRITQRKLAGTLNINRRTIIRRFPGCFPRGRPRIVKEENMSKRTKDRRKQERKRGN